MFILPITSTYVSDWGTWETLREILQNAKDEEDQHDHKMMVKYERGWLRVSNHGADITRKALLLGETTKTDRPDLRGHFGEGLDLALLAGVRAGYDIKVMTKTEVWTPSIEFAEKFNAKVLVVRTTKRAQSGPGVEIRIKMPLAAWKEARVLFRFLVDDSPEYLVETSSGTLLLHPTRRSQVYVKGIYITTIAALEFGYDLKSVKLDRDRRMIDSWNLRWETAKILREGVEKSPGQLGKQVYSLLKTKGEDVYALQYNASNDFADQMVEHFQTEHGKDAIPVESMAESQALNHLGVSGVVVSDTLKKVLEGRVKSVKEIQKEFSHSVKERISWQDMTEHESTTFTQAVQIIHEATEALRSASGLQPLLHRLAVVTFRDPLLRGLCDGGGSIEISRQELSNLPNTLRVLIHEEAHALSGAADGTKEHIDMIQDIWTAIYFKRS